MAVRVSRLFSGSSGTSPAPSPSYVIVHSASDVDGFEGSMVTVRVSQIESESPTTSKPGPV